MQRTGGNGMLSIETRRLFVGLGVLLASPWVASRAKCADPLDPRDELGPRGLEISLRLGYALPLGLIDGDSESPNAAVYGTSVSNFVNGTAGHTEDTMGTLVSGQTPLWIEAGYRLIPNLFVGGSSNTAFSPSRALRPKRVFAREMRRSWGLRFCITFYRTAS